VSTRDDDALRVQLLGPVQAWCAERELSVGPPRRQAVLAMLATRAGRLVSRDELIDGIWGADPPASAVNGLHICVSALRGLLEPKRPAGEYGAAMRSLDGALRLWQSAPLSGISGPWAEAERVRLAELRLAALGDRNDALLACGRNAEVAAELAALVRDHPLHERFGGQLMLALYRGGRRAEALEVYAETRRVLVGELGIEPGTELRRLHQQMLAADPGLDLRGLRHGLEYREDKWWLARDQNLLIVDRDDESGQESAEGFSLGGSEGVRDATFDRDRRVGFLKGGAARGGQPWRSPVRPWTSPDAACIR
jgi:DNA-binding SARP family transcriptional activator